MKKICKKNLSTLSNQRIIWKKCKYLSTLGNRKWLEERYIVEELSAQKIGKTIGAASNTVRDWLKKHDIKIRNRKEARNTERCLKGIRGKNNPSWKGGIRKANGRIYLKAEGHPYADFHGYVQESRLVAEKAIGRYLIPDECVHHINGDKGDNRNCNLFICSNSFHSYLHGKMGSGKKGWFKKGNIPWNTGMKRYNYTGGFTFR
ncbi:MAG: HNH endonuclease [Deltaproteobacteria bacterium]|nr:HNH endonuclease [Deltaproteobacteria bacterium]